MLNIFPDDILSHIILFLPNNKKRNLNTTIILPDYERKQIVFHQQFSANQLKLYIKLSSLVKKHLVIMDKYLQSYFKQCHNSNNGLFFRFNNQCLMYAPVAQYGICRFCNEHRERHKYVKMIDTYRRIRCLV